MGQLLEISFLAPLVLLASLCTSVQSQYTFTQCTNDVQRKIYQSTLSAECTLRYETVNLNAGNFTNAVQTIPSQTVVKRCGGACYSVSHSCYPTKSKMVKVDALVVSTTYGEGFWKTQCAVFQVREDEACSCGCQVEPDDCNILQYYQQETCQCICQNWKERNSCVKNKIWDSRTCSCMCKPSSWRVCSTGYVYDGKKSCECIQTFALAGAPPIIVLIVALISSAGLLVALFIVRNRQRSENSIRQKEQFAKVLQDDFSSS